MNEPPVDNVTVIDPRLSSIAKMRNRDISEGEVNQLSQDFLFEKIDTPKGRPLLDNSQLCFPQPETCIDFSNLTPVQTEMSDHFLQN